jgi:hypothetical protein
MYQQGFESLAANATDTSGVSHVLKNTRSGRELTKRTYANVRKVADTVVV